MAGVNKVILLGRLGKDPELKTFDNGGKICNIVLATSENYTDREGQKVEKTEWHNIVLNDKLADLAMSYLAKGREVYIEGKLRTRNYQDAAGVTKYITEIQGLSMNFVGGKPEGQSNNTVQSNNTTQAATSTSSSSSNEAFGSSDLEDDLPF